ncbi:hypothetical protein [Ralstonia mannitolilytica]|uniref:hypothetical protein n=1 Tax=Ralstonia mannitolilytica TaxID=105219 RepID=UPI001C940D78|nr:hypothetical protein [Ralstonia mannitolilytica]MBY4717527.1 hypothetical protein [Ralstonia mannitolilytica]
MQLHKPFNEYSQEEQHQIMFEAIKRLKAEKDYLEEEVDRQSNLANLATVAQHTYSKWNSLLWLLLPIAFLLGYALRSF